MEQIRISAKNLGQVALDDFCPRCFWIKLHTKTLPWQIFPGIFSSIDAYTKKISHAWIDGKCGRPAFIDELGVTGWEKTLHWSKFNTTIEEFGIVLTGAEDDRWVVPGGIHIPDFKTAKYTKNQDKLLPMYRAQLNGYALIEESLGNTVKGLSIIYMEPATDEIAAMGGAKSEFFDMQFYPKFVPVDIDKEWIFELLRRTREIYDAPIPKSGADCKDCQSLNSVMDMVA